MVVHSAIKMGQVNSAKPTSTDWMFVNVSIDHAPWNAAVYVLAKNSAPQWFQLKISKGSPQLRPLPGNPLQVSGYRLDKVNVPTVSAGHEKLI
jgi:hypothetical protein